MQNQPLPRQVDARKLTATDVVVSGAQPVSDFPRFVEGLSGSAGSVAVSLHFYRDEASLHRISGTASTRVSVICERCLQSMPLSIDTAFELGLVWTEAQAAALPKELDSVIVGEDELELYPLVEDELIVATPFVNFHPAGECEPAGPVEYGEDNPDAEKRENPFDVLKHLKSGD